MIERGRAGACGPEGGRENIRAERWRASMAWGMERSWRGREDEEIRRFGEGGESGDVGGVGQVRLLFWFSLSRLVKEKPKRVEHLNVVDRWVRPSEEGRTKAVEQDRGLRRRVPATRTAGTAEAVRIKMLEDYYEGDEAKSQRRSRGERKPALRAEAHDSQFLVVRVGHRRIHLSTVRSYQQPLRTWCLA